MAKAAIFLDRDGVINTDNGYVSQIEDFHFIDGVIDAMALLKKKGYLLVLVTNQSGIARGLFTEDQFLSLTEWMDWSLADRGVDLDGIYYCPHHPTEGQGKYLKECQCRKPGPDMLLDAAAYLQIDLAASYMVGDKSDDMRAAVNAGVAHPILVETGKPLTDEGRALAEKVYPSLVEFAAALPVLPQ